VSVAIESELTAATCTAVISIPSTSSECSISSASSPQSSNQPEPADVTVSGTIYSHGRSIRFHIAPNQRCQTVKTLSDAANTAQLYTTK